MSFLKNTVSLLAIFSIVPAALAATARPSVLNTATAVSATGSVRRMPTMTSVMGGYTNSGTVDNGGSALLDNLECIDAYTECIQADDACASDMSECTTNVLFHGKMSQCISVLAQCEGEGVKSLFGTSNVLALSDVKETNKYGEVVRYTYPTDSSVLGQMIESARIENQFDSATCVKRYTSCLQKDTVCGADFELCTSDKEFKHQALMCDSTLARCPGAAVEEMLGDPKWTPNTTGAIKGRVADMITHGAELAALNTVSTCYNVIDKCFAGACSANPLRCVAGTPIATVLAADGIVATPDDGMNEEFSFNDNKFLEDGKTKNPDYGNLNNTGVLGRNDVNAYLRSNCSDMIGANKYCFTTFMERTPTAKQLSDPDNQEIVFEEAMDSRKEYLDSKIAGLMQEFTERAQDKCSETIKSCAMRACGGGLGSVCYSQVFGSGTADSDFAKSIVDEGLSKNEVTAGCKAIVDNDVNCKYVAQTYSNNTFETESLWTTSSGGVSAFNTLFTADDPIRVVAALDAALSTSYNQAAIEKMRDRCYASATSCVKSMCGTDYQNCYRNRTDIYSSLTNTNDDAFNRSMNKVNGVLDHTIILGLCVNTIKDSSACKEHLAITSKRYKDTSNGDYANNWGNASTVRDGWLGAGTSDLENMECEFQMVNDNGDPLCISSSGDQGICGQYDKENNEFNKPVCTTEGAYRTDVAAKSLFHEVLANLEVEAQAKYNAKLTREQNVCLAGNAGGLVSGTRGRTYRWATLTNKNFDENAYPTDGIKAEEIKDSNDLYGAFCAIQVSLQSSDPVVKQWLANNSDLSTRYFAAGDGFTCGSWIPTGDYPDGGLKIDRKSGQPLVDCKDVASGTLMNLACNIARDSYTVDKRTSDTILQTVLPAVGAIGGGVGGSFLGDKLWDNAAKNNGKTTSDAAKQCKSKLQPVESALKNVDSVGDNFNTVKKLWKDVEQDESDIVEIIGTAATAATAAKEGSGQTAGKFYCGTSGVEVKSGTLCWGDGTLDDVKAEIQDLINAAKLDCGNEDATGKTKLDKTGAQALGGVLTSVAGGALVYGVTKSAIDANRTAEQQAIIDEFMNSLGSKINCVVGSRVVGTYGGFVETAIE